MGLMMEVRDRLDAGSRIVRQADSTANSHGARRQSRVTARKRRSPAGAGLEQADSRREQGMVQRNGKVRQGGGKGARQLLEYVISND